MTATLFGLVLAGGASTRMQRDKAALQYHGQSQVEWAFELLSGLCAATFVSVRPDQRDDPTRARFPQVVDRQPGAGPIAGISAALQDHPRAAWLVLACDLPFLTRPVLENLIENRDPQRVATAYRSAHDGLPEPLCAIWEPAAREWVNEYMAGGRQCPRKLLIGADVKLLDLPDRRALDNVNTAEELTAAREELGGERTAPRSASSQDAGNPGPERDGPHKTIRVQYYAILREQAGRSEETLDTSANTPAELYEQLCSRHPFQLARAQLKVALNAEFSDWGARLRHGDTVVFIPPVAGG